MYNCTHGSVVIETIAFGYLVGYLPARTAVQPNQKRISEYVGVAFSEKKYGHSDVNQLQPEAAELETTASLHDGNSLKTELKYECTRLYNRDHASRLVPSLVTSPEKPRIHRSLF